MVDLPSYGDGYFAVVDKPPNVISHELTAAVGRLFGLKAGHGGTLDPNVSGVLPIGLGRARRLTPFLTLGRKEYVMLAHLPWAEGLPEGEVERRLKAYEGVITQTPPRHAAVRRRPRKRRVYSIELLEKRGPEVLMRAVVERGTYMRVLAEQMGGRMVELRRTAVEGIREEDAVLVQRLQDEVSLFPILKPCLRHPLWVMRKANLGEVVVKERAGESFLHGGAVFPPGVVEVRHGEKPYYSVRTEKAFLGVGRFERKEGKEVVRPVRVVPLPLP